MDGAREAMRHVAARWASALATFGHVVANFASRRASRICHDLVGPSLRSARHGRGMVADRILACACLLSGCALPEHAIGARDLGVGLVVDLAVSADLEGPDLRWAPHDLFSTGHDVASTPADLSTPEEGDGGVSCGVTINEIQTGTGGSASDEWVELHNDCPQPIDTSGWKLVYESATGSTPLTYYTFATGAQIGANGFFLIVGASYSGSATADGQLSGGLKNVGGGVGIEDATGTFADRVAWGASTTDGMIEDLPAAAPGDSTPPRSIARSPDGSDSERNQLDFRVTSTPTPRAPNSIH
jgi:hypothetical protein